MLILAATPIGRAADASSRLAEALVSADIVAAEDTRRARRLASDLGVQIGGRLVSYFEGNETQRTPELVAELVDGRSVLLITDAGMPAVSDPGYRLVAAAAEADVVITVIPGPSAALAALTLSGLPSDRFCFEGFLPRKAGQRDKALVELAREPRTMIFFEAPHRTPAALAAMAQTFGPGRPAALCRELTKTHEEVVRGTLADLLAWADLREEIRGEVTLVIGGAPEQQAADDKEIRRLLDDALARGLSRRDAIDEVVALTGARKSDVYKLAH